MQHFVPSHRAVFDLKKLVLAITSLGIANLSHAGGLDRSTQPSWAFTQDGTFAYIEHVTISPKITGKDSRGNDVGDMAEDYTFFNYGAKADINDRLSVGAFFDQPWGADVQFSGDNDFVGSADLVTRGVFSKIDEQLKAQGKEPTNATSLSEANEFIIQSEQKLTAGKAKLEKGKLDYQEGLKKYQEGKAKLEAAPAQLEAGRQKLAAGQSALSAGISQLQQGIQKYEAGKAEYEQKKVQLQSLESLQENSKNIHMAFAFNNLSTPNNRENASLEAFVENIERKKGIASVIIRKQIEKQGKDPDQLASSIKTGLIDKGIRNLKQMDEFIEEAKPKLANAEIQLQNAASQIAAGKARLQAGATELSAGRQLYQQKLAEYEAGKAQLKAAEEKLAKGKADIEAGEKQLKEGEAGLKAFKQAVYGVQQMEDANVSIDNNATRVNISSQNFTGVMGLKLGSKRQFQVYGGPVLQKIQGEVSLRGNAYKASTGYDASIPNDSSTGWMAGIAYSKPEIALKAALTYRSSIKHNVPVAESLPLLAVRGEENKLTSNLNIKTPESINLDFQTGVNPTTLLTAKVRYVPWSKFAITPNLYNKATKYEYPEGLPLVSYDKDSWTAEVGLGKKLSDKWAISGAVGWDSGAGNPATSLGPVDGNWNLGLGARYMLTPEWSISGGAKYLKFGDAKAKLPDETIVGDFTNNDGWVYGLRLSYQKK